MKTSRWLAMLLAAAPIWGGVRIKVDDVDLKTNQTNQQELLLDADRMRINPQKGAATSVFFLTDGGRSRIVMLDSSRNEYREMDQQTMNQITQQMQGVFSQLQGQLQNLPPEQRARIEQMMKGRGLPGGQTAAAVPNTYTAGGSASVNGFSCTKYQAMRGTEKVGDLCAAKPADLHLTAADFQILDKLRQFAASLISGLANSPLANSPLASGAFVNLTNPGFEGFPVQYTTYSGGQPTNRTEVKSVERVNFSDADFSLGTAKKVNLIPGRAQ